jgi:biopolymer transport protein ExbD
MRSMMAAVAIVWFIGLAQHVSTQAKPPDAVIGKIAVSAKGAVSLDGKPITVDALKERLTDLKKRDGVVWYYREAGDREPPLQAMQVMKLLVDARLPISMSTKPDYSDVVLPDGSTRPRSQR